MASKRVITREEWEKRLSQVKVHKADLNKLVMNYLVVEGYKDAAERFQRESGTDPGVDLSTVTDRMAIRAAVQRGDIDEAIEKVNDLDPQILDSNPQLIFHLKQQHLIELIRKGAIPEALRFAQEELAPRGEEHAPFLEELEWTMALLAFDNSRESPVGFLLDHSQRQKTAGELNAAILTAQGQDKDAKLPMLLKQLMWAQKQLEEKVKFPRVNNLVTAELETPQ